MQELSPFVQLGPTAAVAIAALWVIWKLNKKNGKNGNGDIKKELQSLKNNHFGTMDAKLDSLIAQAEQNERKLDRIVELLIQIREKLNKAH